MRRWQVFLLGAFLPLSAAADEAAEDTARAVDSVIESSRTYIPAKPIERGPPRYPEVERVNWREAWVHVAYCIDESGKPQNVSIVDSMASDRFEKAARNAVSRWRFEPATVDGRPTWQSRNQVFITFALDPDFKGATQSFRRHFRKIAKLLEDGHLDEADEEFRTLFDSDKLSLYEISKLWTLRARYEILRGDDHALRVALQRATASDGQWIDRRSYRDLLANQVTIDYRLGQYTSALDAYDKLVEAAGEDAPAVVELKPGIDKLREVLQSNVVVKTDAVIRKRIGCVGCTDSYSFSPTRRSFEFADVVGELTSLAMRCDHNRYESAISEQVTWRIPASWGKCHVDVFGEPGTTFSVFAYPDS